MTPTKAVITAANPAERDLPLQTITDSHGETKPALQLILDEVFASGIESVALVIVPGSEEAFRRASGRHAEQVTFLEQADPKGYGHAVWLAREFTGSDPFVLLVGDHLFLSHGEDSCLGQLLKCAARHDGPVSAVQATHESKLHLYGTVGATRVPGSETVFEVRGIIEKPSPTLAEQELIVPGLRHGNYLCFFGMHVMPPRLMEILDDKVPDLGDDTLGLSPSLAELAGSLDYIAVQLDGTRFNLGERYGVLRAQVALALAGPHRDEVLTSLIELLAAQH